MSIVCGESNNERKSLKMALENGFIPFGIKNHPFLINIVGYSPELVDKRLTGIGYTKPCVLDLKMGTRMYGDFATETKRRSQVGRLFYVVK
jgi:hypothetical protein